MSENGRARAYHHGDLRNSLREAARAILEEEGLAALSLRAVARRAGVSHAAPYRHYSNHEALLVELAVEGFDELRREIAAAASGPGLEDERISEIGAAYMRFVARRPALARLMFGPQLPNRDSFPDIGNAADSVGTEIGAALNDTALGLAVWAAVRYYPAKPFHGFAATRSLTAITISASWSGRCSEIRELLPDCETGSRPIGASCDTRSCEAARPHARGCGK
jgi:AcrR family transcriptional regulator